MLQGVLTAFHDAVSLLLRHQVEKRAILENLDLVVLALDETVDNGSVLLLLFGLQFREWGRAGLPSQADAEVGGAVALGESEHLS